jgi:uncharacterized sulfatase
MAKRVHGTLIALGLLSACGGAVRDSGPPNVVLIIGDDHGYPYYGFMGSPIVETPHLDTLAREGTVFTRGYTSASACREALLTLLTGLHPEQWWAKNRMLARAGRRRKNFEEIQDFATLPRLLAQKGYASFQGGKYWEGTYDLGGFTHGMKETVGSNRLTDTSGGAGLTLGRATMQPLWDFLDAHKHRRRFFVWFAPMLPHRPFDAAKRYVARYDRSEIGPWARLYYANITRFDDLVGEIMDYLDREHLRRSTLVIYLSDNGWEQPPDRTTILGGPHGKFSIYDHGFRTPIILSWPGQIREGKVQQALVASTDLFATILDFAGVPAPRDREGETLRPLLTGNGSLARREVIEGVRRLRREGASGKALSPAQSLPEERAYFLRDANWRYVWYLDRRRRSSTGSRRIPTRAATSRPAIRRSLRTAGAG